MDIIWWVLLIIATTIVSDVAASFYKTIICFNRFLQSEQYLVKTFNLFKAVYCVEYQKASGHELSIDELQMLTLPVMLTSSALNSDPLVKNIIENPSKPMSYNIYVFYNATMKAFKLQATVFSLILIVIIASSILLSISITITLIIIVVITMSLMALLAPNQSVEAKYSTAILSLAAVIANCQENDAANCKKFGNTPKLRHLYKVIQEFNALSVK